MRYELGVIRSILSTPGELAWQTAWKMLVSWPDQQEAHQLILPYIEGTVRRWPADIVRWAPQTLLEQMSQTASSQMCGAHLVQGIALPAKLSSLIMPLANNGWFHPALSHIELSDFKTYSTPLEALVRPAVNLSGMSQMTLRGVGMTDDFLESISLLEQLTRLDISDNRLTNGIVEVLLDEELFTALAWLDARGNRLDESARYSLMERSRFECKA